MLQLSHSDPEGLGDYLTASCCFFVQVRRSADDGRSGWCFHQQEALQEGKWHFQCWLPVGSVTYAGGGLSQFILPGAAHTNIPTGWSVLGSSWQTRLDDHHRHFLPRTEQWWITGVEHQAWQENRQMCSERTWECVGMNTYKFGFFKWLIHLL